MNLSETPFSVFDPFGALAAAQENQRALVSMAFANWQNVVDAQFAFLSQTASFWKAPHMFMEITEEAPVVKATAAIAEPTAAAVAPKPVAKKKAPAKPVVVNAKVAEPAKASAPKAAARKTVPEAPEQASKPKAAAKVEAPKPVVAKPAPKVATTAAKAATPSAEVAKKSADAPKAAGPVAPVSKKPVVDKAAATAAPAKVEAKQTATDGRPAGLGKARKSGADTLTDIKGIGPKMAVSLNKMGIYHFDQIAAWTPSEVAWMDENLDGIKGRVSRDDWVAQAKSMIAPARKKAPAKA